MLLRIILNEGDSCSLLAPLGESMEGPENLAESTESFPVGRSAGCSDVRQNVGGDVASTRVHALVSVATSIRETLAFGSDVRQNVGV